MKIFGIIILAIGLALGAYALSMSVAVDVPSRDFGYGINTPAMTVSNMGLMAQRQSYLIFSGILSVVGAILLGFSAITPKSAEPVRAPAADPSSEVIAGKHGATSASVSICPNCRHMGAGDATVCARCESLLSA